MQLNTQLLNAAAAVRLAATPRRKLTLCDEFGPFRGRPFGLDEFTAAASRDSDLATAGLRRSDVAFQVAC